MLIAGLVLSGAYVGITNLVVVHQPVKLVVGWEDSQFAGDWTPSSSNGTPGYIFIANGTLTVGSAGTVFPGAIVSADAFNLATLNVARYPYLSVSVRSPSEYLAVRIVLSIGPDETSMIVLSTFNDHDWHTIYANLAFLGYSGQVSVNLLEIGWLVVQQAVGPNPGMQFQNLRLVAFSGG